MERESLLLSGRSLQAHKVRAAKLCPTEDLSPDRGDLQIASAFIPASSSEL